MTIRLKHRHTYFIPYKLRVIEYSKTHSTRMTSRKYKISRKTVKLWKNREHVYKGKLKKYSKHIFNLKYYFLKVW